MFLRQIDRYGGVLNLKKRVLAIIGLCFFALICTGPLLGTAAETGTISGDSKKGAAENTKTTEDSLGRSTPDGTVMGFMKATQKRDYDQAVEYLNTHRTGKSAQKLIQQLQAVLDRGFTGRPVILSKKREGYLDDGLSPTLERVGSAETSTGTIDILLERVQRGSDGPIWLFAADTLAKVPAAYEELDKFSIEQYLPDILVNTWFLRFPLWQWISVLLVVPISLVIATGLTRLARPLLLRVMERIAGVHGDYHTVQLAGPMRLAIFTVGMWCISFLSGSIIASLFWTYVAAVLTVISICWLLMRIIDIGLAVKKMQSESGAAGKIAVIQLAGKLIKILIAATGAITILYIAGINITAALTGLGIGGIAVAFAAQKTLENLFGGIMIISDRTIHVGDFCRAGTALGVVEEIGLRSTYLRTQDRTIVAIPNGQMASMSIENLSARDKILFRHSIPLRYETGPSQLRHLLTDMRTLLKNHEKVESGTFRVRLMKLGDSSFSVEIFAYVLERGYEDYLEIQENLLLRMLELIEENGTAIAPPAQLTYSGRETAMFREKEKGQGASAKKVHKPAQ